MKDAIVKFLFNRSALPGACMAHYPAAGELLNGCLRAQVSQTGMLVAAQENICRKRLCLRTNKVFSSSEILVQRIALKSEKRPQSF